MAGTLLREFTKEKIEILGRDLEFDLTVPTTGQTMTMVGYAAFLERKYPGLHCVIDNMDEDNDEAIEANGRWTLEGQPVPDDCKHLIMFIRIHAD